MKTSPTLASLQQAVAGLTYPSETDAPFTAFAWPDATGEVTPEEVRRRGRHKPSAPTQVQSVDDLFAPLLQEQDWFGEAEKADLARYRALAEVVKRLLTNPRVVRV